MGSIFLHGARRRRGAAAAVVAGLCCARAAWAAAPAEAAAATKAAAPSGDADLDTAKTCQSINGVVKCGGDAGTEWIVQFGSHRNDEIKGLAIDASTERVYAAGTTMGAIGGEHRGFGDVWMAGITHGGEHEWSTQIGTSKEDTIAGLAAGDGHVVGGGLTYGHWGEEGNSGMMDGRGDRAESVPFGLVTSLKKTTPAVRRRETYRAVQRRETYRRRSSRLGARSAQVARALGRPGPGPVGPAPRRRRRGRAPGGVRAQGFYYRHRGRRVALVVLRGGADVRPRRRPPRRQRLGRPPAQALRDGRRVVRGVSRRGRLASMDGADRLREVGYGGGRRGDGERVRGLRVRPDVLSPRGASSDESRRRRGRDVDIPWRRRRGWDAAVRSRPARASGTGK